MDVLEIIGAVIGIIYLILEYKASPWLWLFGVLMPLFYIYIFYVNGIYANMAINIYYVFASVYGILMWKRIKSRSGEGATEGDSDELFSMPRSYILPVIIAVLVLSLGISFFLHKIGEGDVVILDGLTSALSIVGMWMLAKKYYQQWLCWMIVEPLMIIMSLTGKLYPTAIMYVVYLVIAILGYIRWKNIYKRGRINKK
ncbi:MAG: nicotinamide riboside transporter PnuC [Bacteroidales bacterium]|nr:nicotinamide riboside transporter PnuC [Bacteroidales bacterium]